MITKLLTFTTIMILVLVANNFQAKATHLPNTINKSHIYSTDQFPQTRATNVRQTIRLELPEDIQNVTELNITIPHGLTIAKNITITDTIDNLIPVKVTIEKDQINLRLDQPIKQGTKLNINFNQVQLWGFGRTYQVSLKTIDDRSIYLGTANFRHY